MFAVQAHVTLGVAEAAGNSREQIMNRFNFRSIVAVAVLSGCAGDGSSEREIPLSDVPAQVIRAAEVEFPGIRFTEAEIEDNQGVEVYELEGVVEGKEIEIKLTPDGQVLESKEDS